MSEACKCSYTGLFRQLECTLRVKYPAASLEKWFQVLNMKGPNKSKKPASEADHKQGEIR